MAECRRDACLVRESEDLQGLAVREDGQMRAAWDVKELKLEGRHAFVFDRANRFGVPMRVLVDKVSRARVGPIDELVHGRKIVGCVMSIAARRTALLDAILIRV